MELTVGQKLANILRANRPIYIHVEWYQHRKKYNVLHLSSIKWSGVNGGRLCHLCSEWPSREAHRRADGQCGLAGAP